jgi:ethanolamine utilization protein EutM
MNISFNLNVNSLRPMNTNQTIGILETQGLTAILHATDAMLKAANVELVGKEKNGAAYVTIIIRSDVAAVKAALDAGTQAIGDLGKLIAAHVIARPTKASSDFCRSGIDEGRGKCPDRCAMKDGCGGGAAEAAEVVAQATEGRLYFVCASHLFHEY